MNTYENKLYMVTVEATLNGKDQLTVLVRAENEHDACVDAVTALTHSGYTDVRTHACKEVTSHEVC